MPQIKRNVIISNRILPILLTFLIFFTSKNLFANEILKESAQIIKEKNFFPTLLLKTNTSCGSGFYTNDNKIITASHVVKSCIKNDCSNFEIFHNGKKVFYSSLKIYKISYALDIAILDIALNKPLKNGITLSNYLDVYPNEELKILGFPKCKDFKNSKAIVANDNNLQIHTSSKIHFGSSGSLVVNNDNKFVGMAIRATNVTSAIKSIITGAPLNATLIKGVHINNISALENTKILPYELSKLNEYYTQYISNNYTPTKYPLTFHYMMMANNIFTNLPLYKVEKESFIKEILSSSYYAPYILANISYTRMLNDDEENAENLILNYSFEKKGFTNNDFKILDAISLKTALNTNERSEKHKKNLNLIIDNAKQNIQYSYIISLLATSILFISLLIIIIFIWIFSAGFYFSKFQGNKKCRIIKTILFLLSWPISIIWVIIKEKKNKQK